MNASVFRACLQVCVMRKAGKEEMVDETVPVPGGGLVPVTVSTMGKQNSSSVSARYSATALEPESGK